MQMPYRERTKTLARHWVEYGFGAPKITAFIYIVKLLVLYALGGVLVATLTSGLDPLDPAAVVGRADRLAEGSSCGRCCSSASASPARGARSPATSSR